MIPHPSSSNTTSSPSPSLLLSSKIIRYRWLILLISGIITFGNYYCFDIPTVLYEQLSEYFHLLTFFDLQFNLLYIFYSIPNILLPLFGGYLIDRWGKRYMMIIFSLAILFGQFIVAVGCSMKDFNMILFGRLIFGIGGESLMVSLFTLLTSWFEGKELAFSLSLLFSFARLGGAGNAWISPSISYDKGVAVVFWFGTLLCFFSFVSTLFVVVLDQLFKSPYERNEINRNDYFEIEDSSDGSTLNSNSCPSEYYPDVETYQNTLANSRIGITPLTELPPLDPHLLRYQGPQETRMGVGIPNEETPLITFSTPSSSSSPSLSPPPSSSPNPSDTTPHRRGPTIHFHDSIENIERNLHIDEAEETSELTLSHEQNFSNDSTDIEEKSAVPPLGTQSIGSDPSAPEERSPRDYFTLEDLQSRKKPLWPPQKNVNFWLVLICCCCVYATIIPFISISNEVIRVAYYARRAEKHEEAVEYIVSRLQGVLFLLAALLAPLMGLIIDYIGYRPLLIVTSSLLLFISHFLIMFGLGNPIIPILLVGTAYSLFAAVIWSVVPMIVDGYLQGIAFGLMTSFQNLVQCAVPAIVSYILMENEVHFGDVTNDISKIPSTTRMIGISECEFMFAVLSLAGAFAGIMLWYLDEYPPNNAPRGVLRAATKYSFEEIEKRSHYNPTHVRHYPSTIGSSSSSSSYQSDGVHTDLFATLPSLATAPASTPSQQQQQRQRQEFGHDQHEQDIEKGVERDGDEDGDEGEDAGEDEVDSYKLDRSDWILYDQTNEKNETEMTPLLSSAQNNSQVSQGVIPEDDIPSPSDGSIMPPRRPSILRHFSVYSTARVGPHGTNRMHKSISFTGEGPFPERKPGSGQHPQLQIIVRRNSLNLNHRRFSHF